MFNPQVMKHVNTLASLGDHVDWTPVVPSLACQVVAQQMFDSCNAVGPGLG